MGSIDKACISGFLCRLCSEMHRTVIHIYGDQGQRLCLVEKINGYLPITISPTDPLPKTICESCLRRVEQHYDLLMRLSRIKEKRFLQINEKKMFNAGEVSSPEISDEELSNSNDENQRETPNILDGASTSAAAISTRMSRISEEATSSSLSIPSLNGSMGSGMGPND